MCKSSLMYRSSVVEPITMVVFTCLTIGEDGEELGMRLLGLLSSSLFTLGSRVSFLLVW